MRKSILTALLMYCFAAEAQENKISVTEVHILSGAGGGYAEYGSIADFKSLAPNSEILKKDFTGFDDRSGGMNGITGMNVFQSLQIGLKLPKLKNAVLRVGVMHMEQSDLLTRSGHRSASFAYDTLASTQTGEQYFIDSTGHENYHFQFGSRQIRLDGSLIFRLHGESRWSLHGGIGASLGMAYSSYTELEYSSWYDINLPDQGRPDRRNEKVMRERYEGSNGFAASVYLPMGIDFRIGKTRDFWKPIHLFFETRPAMQLNRIPGRGIRTSAASSAGLGLRFDL